jgi:hypothetical protein
MPGHFIALDIVVLTAYFAATMAVGLDAHRLSERRG